jgi:hypothetical protein
MLPLREGARRCERISARLGASVAPLAVALALSAAPAQADPVIAAAGDIACESGARDFARGLGTATRCRAKHTSDLLVNAGLSAVLPLGDTQYGRGSLTAYHRSYDLSWGRVKSISRPTSGNHEYRTPEAQGYFDYFNGIGVQSGAAGERGKGYYSYEIGVWHLIALNSNCKNVSCAPGSPQERWLRSDLDVFRNTCTLAYWHHPRFSSSDEGSYVSLQPLWRALYNAGADVVLSASGHVYERFAPLGRNGKVDSATGMRQFIVGTGGRSHSSFRAPRAGSEVRNSDTFGVLKLTLHPTGYTWRFVPEAGKSFTDAGTGRCHGRPPPDGTGGGNLSCTLTGTSGDDVLSGTPANDVICGLAGNDQLRGADGDDTILGGDGKDTISGDRGRDRIYGNGGHDGTDGGSGRDVLLGGSGRDRISGAAGRDRIYGSAGNDRIRGGGGRDEMLGGTGKDRVTGGRSRDRVYGNAGMDILRGSSGNDRLVGGGGKDRIFGNAGRDRLSALDHRRGDRVDGGRGRDRASVNRGDRVRRVERVVRA